MLYAHASPLLDVVTHIAKAEQTTIAYESFWRNLEIRSRNPIPYGSNEHVSHKYLDINPEGTSMFEPIGGSAPKYTGKGVINPLAAICSGQMMLEHLGESEAAAAIEIAVIKVVREKIDDLAAGRMGHTTAEVGDLVAAELA